MDLMTELLEVVSGTELRGECFAHLLKACEDHQAFSLKPQHLVQPLIGHINRKLNTPSSRAEGLLLLKTFLPQCSDEVFIDNALSWMLQCLKGIEGHKKQDTGQISYDTLKSLIEMSGQLPELTKSVSNTVVPKVLEQLQNTHQQVMRSALLCIEVLMRNYGGPCGPSKNALEHFLLQFVDIEDNECVFAASRCIALLPLVGGGGSGGVNHRNAWLSLQQQICVAMNEVLDDLFEHVTEIQSVPLVSAVLLPKLQLADILENSPSVITHQYARRFINLARFVQSMLKGEFPVGKLVLPNILFGLICRGLAINCNMLSRNVSTEKVMVSCVLPQIHIALFQLLRSLIACCGSTLLQYGSLICKLVLQTLKWTTVDSWCYGMEKPYGKLRVEACAALEDWLVCAKTGSCVELHADQLVPALMADIQTARTTVKLTVQTAGKKFLSKRQKKALSRKQDSQENGISNNINSDGSSIGRSKLVDYTANQEACCAALRALQWIFQAGGIFVQLALHKTVQSTSVILLMEVQRSSEPQEYPLPYSSYRCRLEMYRLVHVLVLEPHPFWPPPTQFALHLLAAGQSDSSLEVSAFCTLALSSATKTVQPAHPTLEFPLLLEELKNADIGGPHPTSAPSEVESAGDDMKRTGHSKRNTPDCTSKTQQQLKSKQRKEEMEVVNEHASTSKKVTKNGGGKTRPRNENEVEEVDADSDVQELSDSSSSMLEECFMRTRKKNSKKITAVYRKTSFEPIFECCIEENVDDEECVPSRGRSRNSTRNSKHKQSSSLNRQDISPMRIVEVTNVVEEYSMTYTSTDSSSSSIEEVDINNDDNVNDSGRKRKRSSWVSTSQPIVELDNNDSDDNGRVEKETHEYYSYKDTRFKSKKSHILSEHFKQNQTVKSSSSQLVVDLEKSDETEQQSNSSKTIEEQNKENKTTATIESNSSLQDDNEKNESFMTANKGKPEEKSSVVEDESDEAPVLVDLVDSDGALEDQNKGEADAKQIEEQLDETEEPTAKKRKVDNSVCAEEGNSENGPVVNGAQEEDVEEDMLSSFVDVINLETVPSVKTAISTEAVTSS